MAEQTFEQINFKSLSSNVSSVLLYILFALVFLLHYFSEFKIYAISIDKWAFISFTILSFFSYRNEFISILRNTPLKYLTYFGAVVCIVNSSYYFYFNDTTFLINTGIIGGVVLFSFGTYSFLVRNWDLAFSIITIMSLLGIVITLFECFSYEKTAYFNNLNQVTRAVLFFGCIYIIANKRDGNWQKETVSLIAIFVSLVLSFYLLRRAAIISSLFFIIIYIYIYIKSSVYSRQYIKYLLTILPILGVIYIGLNFDILLDRFMSDGPGSTFSGRGLTRIFEDSQYLIYGAGDGRLERFELAADNVVEPHATLLYVWFTFGICGFLSYCWYYYQSLKNLKFDNLVFFIPIFIHSMFHNDIRNVYLLVLPLLILTYIHKLNQS